MCDFNKLRTMEEEMSRFEAEISAVSNTPNTSSTFKGFIPHQLHGIQASRALDAQNKHHTTIVSNVSVPKIDTSAPPKLSMPIQKTVFAAPAKMATPEEIALKKMQAEKYINSSLINDEELDDDVTRALLAAAAGVSYSKTQMNKDQAKQNKNEQTKTNTAGVGPSTSLHLVPDLTVPPPSMPSNSIPDYPGKKQKKFLRVAAGQVWNDPTLNEWERGPEVTDDTLARVFSRYPSFRKAKVIRDKRSQKSRGYGFVSFSDPDDFTKAMREVNGKYVGNRPIKLRKSEWKSRQLEVFKKKEKEKKKLGLKL